MIRFFFNYSPFFIALLLLCFSTNGTATDNNIKKLTLRTGFFLNTFPDIERVDLEAALKYWTSKFSKQTGIPASIHLYKNLKNMKRAFEENNINFIVSSPLAFIENFDLQQLTDGYKVYSEGSATEDLLIITHVDSNINSVADFKNKHLSLLFYDKTCSMFVNTLTLEYFNDKAESVFKHVDHVFKSPQLIYKLFFKQTDIILVYQRAYQLAIELNPQIKRQTRIIHKLPNMYRGLGFFHKRVDPDFRELIITELKNMHTSFQGRQLLNIFYADQLKRSSLKDLSNSLKLKQTYEKLIKKRGFSY